MTKEQLIQAMSLFGFQETIDYTIDQDYASISMIAPEANKPTEEQLQEALDAENARLAAEAEAQRKAAVQERLEALPDIAVLLGLYINQNQEQVNEDDSMNIAGFSTVDMLESNFGWNFANLAKPTIDDLEALIPTKEAQDQEKAWENLRKERDKKLVQSDFTQLSDSPLTSEQKAAWASYRQALRDLPSNIQDPSNPIWPNEP